MDTAERDRNPIPQQQPTATSSRTQVPSLSPTSRPIPPGSWMTSTPQPICIHTPVPPVPQIPRIASPAIPLPPCAQPVQQGIVQPPVPPAQVYHNKPKIDMFNPHPQKDQPCPDIRTWKRQLDVWYANNPPFDTEEEKMSNTMMTLTGDALEFATMEAPMSRTWQEFIDAIID